MKVEMGKEYRTRDGQAVTQLVVFDAPKYTNETVFGVLDGEVHGWCDDGSFVEGTASPEDLIEVRPRIKRDVWVNITREAIGNAWLDKTTADSAATDNRIACVKLTIDCEEGEGLS